MKGEQNTHIFIQTGGWVGNIFMFMLSWVVGSRLGRSRALLEGNEPAMRQVETMPPSEQLPLRDAFGCKDELF
jgi:hypothetical protein